MAKHSKNQNRQREHQDDQRNAGVEAQEQAKSTAAEERILPSAEQVSRKHQRRFGHN